MGSRQEEIQEELCVVHSLDNPDMSANISVKMYPVMFLVSMQHGKVYTGVHVVVSISSTI